MLIEHNRRLVCCQHMQEDHLHLQPVAQPTAAITASTFSAAGRCQAAHQGVQQQRRNAIPPVLFVNAQRQNVRHLGVLVRTRFRQNVAILFVHAHERLDFGHNQADDGHVVHGGQRIETRTRCDVNVPGQWIVDGEPILAQGAHLLQVVGTQESQLHVGGGTQRHQHCGGGGGGGGGGSGVCDTRCSRCDAIVRVVADRVVLVWVGVLAGGAGGR